MGIFDSYYIKKACDEKLSWSKREKALGKVRDQGLLVQLASNADAGINVRRRACKCIVNQGLLVQLVTDRYADVRRTACDMVDNQELLAKIATTSSFADTREAACFKVKDKGLLAKIATEAAYSDVRITAFHLAFDQLVDDHGLCCRAVDDCIAQIEKHESHASISGANLLAKIATHSPETIRQFWGQIEAACHEDNPSSRHYDGSAGSDCLHEDNHGAGADPHHRDRPNSELLQDFPAAARSLVC
jgi:hypothetical protein